jgi:hypothetical protein
MAWIRHVLGVDLPVIAAPAELAAAFQAASDGYAAALDAVDRQLATLKAALLATGESDYEDVAEQCLDEVIGEAPRRLTKVLGQVDGADLGRTAARVRPAVARIAQSIAASPQVAACDTNPLRVKVAIRRTLGGALTRLEDVLARAGGG